MANSDLIQSVLKAADILQLVASRPGIRLNELAELLDMKKPTVHNLVRTLRARDFLRQDESRKLELGPALGELISRQSAGGILQKAEQELLKLARRFPEAVLTLSELAGCEIFCRLRCSPDRPGELQRPINFTFPFYSTVSGMCLQAFGVLDASELERKYPYGEFGAPLWGDRANLQGALERFRRAGYVDRLLEGGDYYAAFPVGGRFTLGFHGPAADRDKTARILQSAAARIV